jgi:hypothetical protein
MRYVQNWRAHFFCNSGQGLIIGWLSLRPDSTGGLGLDGTDNDQTDL